MKNKPDRALVLMTALLPTVGHMNLVKYALSLIKNLNHKNGTVDLLISGRSFEPIKTVRRYRAFRDEFKDEIQRGNLSITYFEIDDIPQNPEDDENFWNIWKEVIFDQSYIDEGDIVVGSEPYGYKLAESLGCTFYPYDIERKIDNVKGTKVRFDITSNFNKIIPSMRYQFQTTITLFGAESCGKTTTSEWLAFNHLNGHLLTEWARPYLYHLGNPSITPVLMEAISKGQSALQKHARKNLNDKPFIIQDTDLLSTIGYYKIMGLDIPEDLARDFLLTMSDVYFLIPIKIFMNCFP